LNPCWRCCFCFCWPLPPLPPLPLLLQLLLPPLPPLLSLLLQQPLLLLLSLSLLRCCYCHLQQGCRWSLAPPRAA
jgi:hypothetical protein